VADFCKEGISQRVWSLLRQIKQNFAQVGTISANGEKAIGDLLADAMERVGKEGVITVQARRWIDHSLTQSINQSINRRACGVGGRTYSIQHTENVRRWLTH